MCLSNSSILSKKSLVINNGSFVLIFKYILIITNKLCYILFIIQNFSKYLNMKTIGIIGTGKMGEALIESIIHLEYRIIGSDVNNKTRQMISQQYGIKMFDDNYELAKNSDIILLAVKPQYIQPVLKEISEFSGLVISIAAGITIRQIKESIPGSRIARVMPNTPCLVGEMAAGYSFSDDATQQDKKIVNELLNTAGVAVQLDENLIDAVTGLSGSGPAFVARLINYFILAGKNSGLSEKTARQLTVQTFLGTAKLLQKKNLSPEELITMVSSPGGTTIEGRKVLEKSDIKEVIDNTVLAAVNKSKELGKNK
ncbi:pyrroline-5-carboxylate reductase [Candidatus Woesearchaeota archaeon]|nr:pyrroline-5-carboxylate reductase [Candidatus Woesearchaeota archaeon]